LGSSERVWDNVQIVGGLQRMGRRWDNVQIVDGKQLKVMG